MRKTYVFRGKRNEIQNYAVYSLGLCLHVSTTKLYGKQKQDSDQQCIQNIMQKCFQPKKIQCQMLYNDIRFHCKDGEKYVC